MARIPCGFSCNPEFLALIDERAQSLGMNRSQYIVQVIRNEIARGGADLSVVGSKIPDNRVAEPRAEYVTNRNSKQEKKS